jgi:hypothetical protein
MCDTTGSNTAGKASAARGKSSVGDMDTWSVLSRAPEAEPLLQARPPQVAPDGAVPEAANESDSDDDMADIMRSMASNPFARNKPGAKPAAVTAAPAVKAASTRPVEVLAAKGGRGKPLIQLVDEGPAPSSGEVLFRERTAEPLMQESVTRRAAKAEGALNDLD